MTINVNLDLLDKVEVIAREAGLAILKFYTGDFSANIKADNTPVTDADLLAHSIIKTRLSGLEYVLPILSEEAIADFTGPDNFGFYWLIDPLDGTKEFINRNGEFTVNIALIKNGQPILGVIYAPAFDEIYSGVAGLGAFKTSQHSIRRRMYSNSSFRKECFSVIGSRSHNDQYMKNFLNKLDQHEFLVMGSSLKFCKLADGSVDIYPRFGHTSFWDTAAGQCILICAGGYLCSLDGKELSYSSLLSYNNPPFIAYGNKNFLNFREIL